MGARIRSIKPEFWQDERIGTLPMRERLLFLGLISHADDSGRMRGNPLLIRAQVFPYDDGVDVQAGLDELERRGRIIQYAVGGERYVQLVNFRKHQSIEKPKASAFPEPPETSARRIPDSSPTHPRLVPDASPLEGKGEEGKGREGRGVEGSAPPPPSASGDPAFEFFAWAQERRIQTRDDLMQEVPPKNLATWWDETQKSGATREQLRAAFERFLRDSWAATRNPPFAFQVFAGGEPGRGKWRAHLVEPAKPKRDVTRGRVGAEEVPPNAHEVVGEIEL